MILIIKTHILIFKRDALYIRNIEIDLIQYSNAHIRLYEIFN